MTSLTIAGVSKTLGGVPVLSNLSLTVDSGSRAAIVGASGSGKSTLLRLIAGFDRVDAGQISLAGALVSGDSTFVAAHRRGVGYVAQDGALFPHLTVERNIRFGLAPGGSRSRRVREVAELVALDPELLKRYPHEISGGQQQRVALARALAPAPSVILLDEPFSALDTGLRAHTRQAVIDALEASDVTTILVTHDQEEALSFGQQIAVIADGAIVQAGAPFDVFESPLTAETALFLGDAVFLPCTASRGTVSCSLGQLTVRHDHRGEHPSGAVARALVRPSQLSVEFEPEAANATIVEAQYAGDHVELVLRLSGGAADDTIAVALATAEARQFRRGRAIGLRVNGPVNLY